MYALLLPAAVLTLTSVTPMLNVVQETVWAPHVNHNVSLLHSLVCSVMGATAHTIVNACLTTALETIVNLPVTLPSLLQLSTQTLVSAHPHQSVSQESVPPPTSVSPLAKSQIQYKPLASS